MWIRLTKMFEGTDFTSKLISSENLLAALRGRKTEAEIDRIKKAVDISEEGRFILKEIEYLEEPPEVLWEMCGAGAGISEEEFFHYFLCKIKGYAIAIYTLEKIDPAIDPRQIIPNFRALQSFRYLDDVIAGILNN